MHDEFDFDVGTFGANDSEGLQFQADILAPYEFWQTYRSRQSRQPELELMKAVLEDALFCYFKNVECRTRRQRKIFRETQEWFFNTAEDELFTFKSVCAHLGLDPDYIRRGLILCKRAHEPEPQWQKTIDGKKQLAA